MGEEKNFIFRISAETQGIQKSLQEVRNYEAGIKKSAENIQRTILAPSGRSAAEEVARQTPSMLQTAEQRVILSKIASSQIVQPTGYIQGMAQRERYIPFSQQQQLMYKGSQPLQLPYYPSTTQQDPWANLKPKGGAREVFLPTKEEVAFSKSFEEATKFNKTLDDLNLAKSKGQLSTSLYNSELNKLYKTMGMSRDNTKGLDMDLGKLALRAAATIPIWLAMRSAVMGVLNAISTGVKFLIEFESALADIRIVGKGTEEDYRNLGSTLIRLSETFGVSASEALKAAKIFAQQGLTINETLIMTRNSMIASVILGKTMSEVSEDLTSATRAYNVEMENSLSLVDKWQAVQKNFAVTSSDLAEATKTAGASAAALGISYDKFLGHVTAIIEVTRKSGSQAANALQIIYSRLFTVARESIQVIAQVPVYQNETGKAVMETTHIFRSASDIIDDVALSWNNLSESQKINLAAQIGSRRQLTPFIALMENYNKAIEAEITSLGAAGQAYEDFKIKLETTELKVKQLQSSWVGLVSSIGNTSVFKATIDYLRGIVDGLGLIIARKETLNRLNKEEATEELLLREAREQELLSLDQLIKKRDEFNRKLQETKSSLAREQIQEFLKQIDTAIGGRSLISGSLEEAKRATERSRIQTEFTEENRRLDSLRVKWMELKNLQKETGVSVYSEDIKNLEEQIKLIEDKFNKEVTMRLANKDLAKQENEARERLRKIAQEDEIRSIEKLRENQLEVDHLAKMSELRNIEEEEILQWKIKQYETDGLLADSENARLEKKKLEYELEEKLLENRMKYSNLLKDSLQESFKGIMSGEAGFGNLFSNLRDTLVESYRDTVAEGLSNVVMSTGIGDIFGGSMLKLKAGLGGIRGLIETAHETVYDLIVRGHRDGLTTVGSTIPLAGRAAYPGTSLAGLPIFNPNVISGGEFGGTNTGMQQTSWSAQPFPTWSPYDSSGRRGKTNVIQGVAIGSQSVLSGYSAYQSARAGGVPQGQSIASGVLMGVGTGAMAVSAGLGAGGFLGGATSTAAGSLLGMGPAGWLILAIGAMILGLVLAFTGGKKSTSTQVEEQTTQNRISSKIDTTNKNLEIINRNLLGIKSSIETFVLPSSAYFASHFNMSEEWAIYSQRGLQG